METEPVLICYQDENQFIFDGCSCLNIFKGSVHTNHKETLLTVSDGFLPPPEHAGAVGFVLLTALTSEVLGEV